METAHLNSAVEGLQVMRISALRKQIDWRVQLRMLVKSWNRVGKMDSEGEQWGEGERG